MDTLEHESILCFDLVLKTVVEFRHCMEEDKTQVSLGRLSIPPPSPRYWERGGLVLCGTCSSHTKEVCIQEGFA